MTISAESSLFRPFSTKRSKSMYPTNIHREKLSLFIFHDGKKFNKRVDQSFMNGCQFISAAAATAVFFFFLAKTCCNTRCKVGFVAPHCATSVVTEVLCREWRTKQSKDGFIFIISSSFCYFICSAWYWYLLVHVNA